MTSAEIRDNQFQTGMNGYKKAEVDQFLDRVIEQFDSLSAEKAAVERRLEQCAAEVAEYKKNESVLQTALLNAQRLANQITEDAKAEAAKILECANAEAEQITSKAAAQSSALIKDAEATSAEMLARAKSAAEKLTDETQRVAALAVEAAKAEASERISGAVGEVAAQRELLGVLRTEAAAFKRELLAQYDAQLLLINQLPDSGVLDAEQMRVISGALIQAVGAEPTAEQTEPEDERNAVEVIIDQLQADSREADAAVEEVMAAIEEAAEPIKSEPEMEAAAEIEPAAEQTEDNTQEDEPIDDSYEPEASAEQPVRRGGFTVTLFDDDEDDLSEKAAPTSGGQLSFGGQPAKIK